MASATTPPRTFRSSKDWPASQSAMASFHRPAQNRATAETPSANGSGDTTPLASDWARARLDASIAPSTSSRASSPDPASSAASATYGEGLRRDLGYTPLLVRYNTGLHVSDNGRALALLLERIVEAWPLAVREVVLVGHSMGGLVARSACHYGDLHGSTWAARVRHVVSLGTPHLGAPLEKATNVVGWALARWPESVPFARFLTARSAGVKDLRFGAVIDDDWQGHDPDEFLRDRCREMPFLHNAHYYFVGATIGQDPAGLAGRVLGDLLVRLPSASGDGRHRRIPFEIDHGHHLTGVNHFDLLNHPAVYDQLHQWLAATRSDSASTSLAGEPAEIPRCAEASSGRAESGVTISPCAPTRRFLRPWRTTASPARATVAPRRRDGRRSRRLPCTHGPVRPPRHIRADP